MTWDSTDFRAGVQDALDTFIDEQARLLRPLGEDAALLVDHTRRTVRGGKQLRAAFCYWGYRSVRSEVDDAPALMRAAASLELLHASALVHDDFMDDSDTRRGRPAVHKAFESWHRSQSWPGDAQQYGAAAAILLGDLLLSWADEMLRTCGLADDLVRASLRFFDMTRSEVIAGQFLDLSVQARAKSDVDQAMRVLRYKSAKYSVERPLHMGAALAGADEKQIAALTEFGLPLGEAFQLRDDLLGVFGDPAVTGKPAGDDLTEGKRTVLVALTRQAVSGADAALLEAKLGSALSEAEITELRDVIDASGARAECERRIEELTAHSLEALEDAPLDATARDVLADLARAATQRAL